MKIRNTKLTRIPAKKISKLFEFELYMSRPFQKSDIKRDVMTDLPIKQKALHQARQQFKQAADRSTKALTKQRKRLQKDLERAVTTAKRSGEQLQKKADRLAKATGVKAKRELRSQILKLDKTRATAMSDSKEMRGELAIVRDDLSSARKHLTHALHIDKAMAKIEKELAKRFGKKSSSAKNATKKTAKKSPAAKKSVKRKVTVKKKAPAKKKAAAKQKAPAKKKATAKRKAPARKKTAAR